MEELDDTTIRKLALGEFSWNEAALIVYEGNMTEEVKRRIHALIHATEDGERQRLEDRYRLTTLLARKYGRLYQLLRDDGDVNAGSYFMPIPPP